MRLSWQNLICVPTKYALGLWRRRGLKFRVKNVSIVMWVSFKWTLTPRARAEKLKRLPTHGSQQIHHHALTVRVENVSYCHKNCSFSTNGIGNWSIALQWGDLSWGILAYWVKYYIEMQGISCYLDFDPIHQSDWLGVYLGCAGRLPNFDHCGK